jgi:hypothetical protein
LPAAASSVVPAVITPLPPLPPNAIATPRGAAVVALRFALFN